MLFYRLFFLIHQMKKSLLLLLIWICVSFGGANASSFFTACVLSKLRLNWWQNRNGASDRATQRWCAWFLSSQSGGANRTRRQAAGLPSCSRRFDAPEQITENEEHERKIPRMPCCCTWLALLWRVHNPFNFAPWHAVIMWMLNKGILGGGQVTTLMKWPHRRLRY